MRSKPYGDPSMGLRWPRAECYDAQGPPWLYPQKVQSRAMTLLGERPTGQKRTQRAASLILGQPPRGEIVCELLTHSDSDAVHTLASSVQSWLSVAVAPPV